MFPILTMLIRRIEQTSNKTSNEIILKQFLFLTIVHAAAIQGANEWRTDILVAPNFYLPRYNYIEVTSQYSYLEKLKKKNKLITKYTLLITVLFSE